MKCPAVLALSAAAAFTVGLVGPARAQAHPPSRVISVPVFLQVTARSDLTFGNVLPGVRSSVSPHDVLHAGLFEIQGPNHGSVRIEFALPGALTADGGGYLPVTFSSGDGYVNINAGGPHGAVFDPRTPLVTTLSADGRLFVRLGGSVQPTVPQAGGTYRATITLTVYDLGT